MVLWNQKPVCYKWATLTPYIKCLIFNLLGSSFWFTFDITATSLRIFRSSSIFSFAVQFSDFTFVALQIINVCCVFRPASGCFTCCWLVKIIFFSVKTSFSIIFHKKWENSKKICQHQIIWDTVVTDTYI